MHNSDKPAFSAEAHAAAAGGGGCANAGQPKHGRYRHWLGKLAIRPLSVRHRAEIATHLLALPPRDRYLRFGYYASNAQIERYVAQLNFERDALYGMFSKELRLVAFAHLALPACWELLRFPAWHHGQGMRMAEFGVSVLPGARGQGMGSRLYAHAVQEARARGMDTLTIQALSENATMLNIVSRHGACVVNAGVEAEAFQQLSPAGWGQRLEHHVQNQFTRACHAVLSRWRVGRDWLCVH